MREPMPMRMDAAYDEHLATWTTRYGTALAMAAMRDELGAQGLADMVFTRGALELVSPLEPPKRDALAKAGCGLPWGGRLDLELYWRILYAAHAERQVAGALGDARLDVRPIRQVAAVTLTVLRKLEGDANAILRTIVPQADEGYAPLLDGIIRSAAHEIALRTGNRPPPKPMEVHAIVDCGGIKAELAGIDPNGGALRLSRETRPGGAEGWTFDAKNGRWTATAMPWQVRHDR